MEKDLSRPSDSDQDEIVAGIEQARTDLADTVQALAAKVDVPARVRDKAGQTREQISGTLATLSRTARDRAPKVRDRVAESLTRAGQALPEPARSTAVRTARQATDAARKRPAVRYAAAGTLAAAGLLLWRRKKRS